MIRLLALVLLDLFVAGGAFFGGTRLLQDPTGASLGLPRSLLGHTPFASYLLPGVLLTFVVGGTAATAAVGHLRRRPGAGWWSAFAGATLAAWLVAQVALIRTLDVWQAVMFAVAVGQLALGPPRADRRDVSERARDFFAAGRVALVGLSAKRGDFSHAVADALRAHGVEVVGVNPNHRREGTYAHLADIPQAPAAALLMIPAGQSDKAVQECIDAGVRRVWFHRGAGAGSASPEAVRRATEAGLEVITDACPLMFLEPAGAIHRIHRWTRGHARCEPRTA